MYLLSKVDNISKEKESELSKKISRRNSINEKDLFLLKNPLHLNNGNLVNIKDFKCIYNISNSGCIIKNEKLSDLISEKSENDLKRILINSYRDNMFCNSFMEQYFNNYKFHPCDLDYTITDLNILLNELYSSESNPNEQILNKKYSLENKNNRSFIEDSILYILKNRATRFSIINIINNLKQINQSRRLFNRNKEDFEVIEDILEDDNANIIFLKKELDSICEVSTSNNPKYITSYDSYSILKFKNTDEIIESFVDIANNSNPDNVYIYLEKNNAIIKKVSYEDFIKLKNGIEALERIITNLKVENIEMDLINENVIEYIYENKLINLANLLINKLNIKNELLDLLIENNKNNQNNKNSSVLSMIQKRYA